MQPAEAAFDPSIAVETLYTSDIRFGQGVGVDEVAAWEDSLFLDLPWSWNTRNTVYSFIYVPSQVVNREDSSLNRTDHTARFLATTKPGRNSLFTVEARYTRTQRQVDLESDDDADSVPAYNISRPAASRMPLICQLLKY